MIHILPTQGLCASNFSSSLAHFYLRSSLSINRLYFYNYLIFVYLFCLETQEPVNLKYMGDLWTMTHTYHSLTSRKR